MPRKNYKGNRNARTKGKSNFRKDENREKVDKPTNDPSWYSKYPQLVNDTGNLFFSNPLGARVPKVQFDDGAHFTGSALDYTPGIVSLECVAVPGYSNSPNSPVNAIARGIYSYIRHANSGHSNYDSPDLMMYLLAIDTCYSFWASCVRAYGIARMYNVRSRYLAIQFLEAMGFDPANILANLAQFRAEINNFAVKLSSYAVPASMDFFRRHTDMYTRVYLDEPSAKAQSYMFTLGKYYRFNNTTQDGGKLIMTDFPSETMTVADVKAVFSNLVDPIIGDEDMNIMSGDILKAYGDTGIFKIPMIDEGYMTPIIFDEVVLSQIENSMAVPELDSTTMGVTQDPTTSSIYFAPQCDADKAKLVPKKIINIHHDNPQPMDVMEATRLMYSVEMDNGVAKITNFGTELVLSYIVWSYNASGMFNPYVIHSAVDFGTDTVLQDNVILMTISNLCSFNFHPRVVGWVTYDASKVMVLDHYALDNYTTIEDTTLASISNTAMLSLFDVGRIALMQ